MEANNSDNNFSALDELEQHVAALLSQNNQLNEENKTLRKQHESLFAEKAMLIEKNRKVHAKIETILSRLKNLEQSA